MNKIFNIKWLLLLLFPVITIVSCKKGNDLYISPNAPEAITPALQLTAIQVSTFNSYESGLAKFGSILIQHNVGVEGQALPINNYLMVESEFDNQWGQLYQAIFNCKDLQEKFGANNPYYSGMADVLAVMNWGILTDLWGDIPFSEALQGNKNYQPKYDAQKDVIAGMLRILDEGVVKLSKAESDNEQIPGSDDLIYGGDTEKWIKLAYSLKARYQNRLSNTSMYNANDVLISLSKGFTSSDDDLVTAHGATSTELNQWFDFQNNREFYIVAGQPLVDSMGLRPTDKRLQAYFNVVDTSVIGSPVDNPTSENVSEWGRYLAGGPDVGVRIVSFVEMKFIEAEVKARQGSNAASILNDAIQESCIIVTKGAYDGSDIANYTAANTNLGRVMYEKWIAMFGSFEPYNDYRKTGFPALTVNPSGSLSVIPKRFPTPQIERVNNTNAPVPALTQAVWFGL